MPLDDINDCPLEPRYATIQHTTRITGLSTVGVYRLIASSKLRAAKAGSWTLVELASLEVYLASLPRFVGRTGLSKAG